jgi:hypothetical protein
MQRKRWTPIALMGCVHIHQRIPIIKGRGNPSRVYNVMEKDEKIIERLRRLIEL